MTDLEIAKTLRDAAQYIRALAVTPLSQDAAAAVCDNAVPEAVNA